jgi:hypothetical protein
MHRTYQRLLGLIVPLALLCVGCGTTRPTTTAPCITESMKGLVIRWGTEDEAGNVRAWQLTTKGELFDISAEKDETADTTYVTYLAPEAYCERAAAVKDAFLQTQAMNVRGARARFVEYVNAASTVYLRVVWNPDLSTFQSRYFRAEYDALMQHVPAT